MGLDFKALLTVTFTLFAVIDIVGSVPILISLKEKLGGIRELRATLISGVLMILFMYVGETFLKILGLDIGSFAANSPEFEGIKTEGLQLHASFAAQSNSPEFEGIKTKRGKMGDSLPTQSNSLEFEGIKT